MGAYTATPTGLHAVLRLNGTHSESNRQSGRRWVVLLRTNGTVLRALSWPDAIPVRRNVPRK